MRFPTIAQITRHPAFETAVWKLRPNQSGLLPVGATRGGPYNISWEIHGNGPIKVVVRFCFCLANNIPAFFLGYHIPMLLSCPSPSMSPSTCPSTHASISPGKILTKTWAILPMVPAHRGPRRNQGRLAAPDLPLRPRARGPLLGPAGR